jgi:hypothetical protein
MSAAEELEALRSLLDDAADRIINAASDGLEQIGDARAGSGGAIDGIQQSLKVILEACSFHDLAGQRLSRLAAVDGGVVSQQAVDPLLQGPANPGEGLDQAAADALFSGSGGF